MEFIEKDLEQIIYETENIFLKKRGLNLTGKKLRQLKIGNYGVTDLITWERKIDLDLYASRGIIKNYLEITVLELKKEKIGISAFLQSIRYIKGIQSFFQNRIFDTDICVRAILIGKTIDTSGEFCYIPDFINQSIGFVDCSNLLEIYTYSYRFDGIKFEKQDGFKLTNEGF